MTLPADPGPERGSQDPPRDFDHAPLVMKVAFTFFGLLIIAIGTGIIRTSPGYLHAPRWVVVAMGLLFLLAALLMWIGSHRLLHPALYMFVAATMASSLAAVFCWAGGWFKGPLSPFVGVGPVFVDVGGAAGVLSRVITAALGLLAVWIAAQGWLRWWRAVRGLPVGLGS